MSSMVTSANLPQAVRLVSMLLLTTTLLACGGGAPSTPLPSGDAGSSPPAIPASSAHASPAPVSSPSGLCGLFTPDELARFLGTHPPPGSAGGPLGSTCEWDVGDGFLMIQKVPVEFFEDHRGAKSYRQLDKIGDYAFVAGHPFGRITAARTSEAAYVVVASEVTDEAGQIDILRLFVERSPGTPVLDAPDQPDATPPGDSGSGDDDHCPVSTDVVSEAAEIEMVQTDGCSWAAADSGTLFEVLIANVPTALFEYLREQQPVAGVGDEAYADTGVLYVRVGDRAFSIQLITLTLDEQEALQVATAIARHAVDGLR